ncbi:MAG: hypothetical protein ACOC5T_05945 [Elusimicrobiota bacterium]
MSKVQYNSELFDLVKDLTSINTQIVFEKDDEENILVRRSDSESTIAYELKAPREYFDFSGEKVAFYQYPVFFQYFKAIGEPEIHISEKSLTLKEKGSKTNYLLSNPESIEKGPREINFVDPDIRINLTSGDLDEILKMIALINAKKVQVFGNDDKLTIKVYQSLHDNTFEKTFEVENLSNIDEEIDFVMFAETFKNLPVKRDYTVEIKKQGFIKISLVDENISLDIYTGKIKG